MRAQPLDAVSSFFHQRLHILDLAAILSITVSQASALDFSAPAREMQTPAERYRRSERTFQAKAVKWQYPEVLGMLRVGANGMIRWDRRRHYFCEAWVHHHVAVEQIGGELLVRFRNLYTRQIDLQTARTMAFIHPVSDPL